MGLPHGARYTDPGHVDANNNLAFVLNQRGNVDDAVRHYQAALQTGNDVGRHCRKECNPFMLCHVMVCCAAVCCAISWNDMSCYGVMWHVRHVMV